MKLVHPSAWSLSTKLAVIVCLVVVGVATVIGVGVAKKDRDALRDALAGQARLLARWVATEAGEPMLRNDIWPIYRLVRQTAAEGDANRKTILTIMVLDTDGLVVAHLQPERNPIGLPLAVHDDAERRSLASAMTVTGPTAFEDPARRFIEGVAPISVAEKRLGVARVRLSTEQLAEATREATMIVVSRTLPLAAVGSLVGIILSLGAVRTLKQLAESMARMGRGEHVPLMLKGGDEIARLGEAFNRMAEEVAAKQRLERELAQSEKAAALGRIAAGVAHEVNNPLAGILNCISTIRDHPEEPRLIERYLPLIERGLLRIRAIVRDLLIEQRAENASEASEPARLDEIREQILASIANRNIVLDWNNDVPDSVQVNRPRIQQVVLNLVENAIHAMPTGGRLRFAAVIADERFLRMAVEDDGIGIAPENLPRIFDPFFSSKPEGTGLGLWITARLLQAMGGTIDVQSEAGSGTRFSIRVPYERRGDGPAQQ